MAKKGSGKVSNKFGGKLDDGPPSIVKLAKSTKNAGTRPTRASGGRVATAGSPYSSAGRCKGGAS